MRRYKPISDLDRHTNRNNRPSNIYALGLQFRVEQIYFIEEKSTHWNFVFNGAYKKRDYYKTFRFYFTDKFELMKKSPCYLLFTHDQYLRLREPPESLNIFSNKEWERITRSLMKLNEDACDKLSKLEGQIAKNPHIGLSIRYYNWHSRLHRDLIDFRAKMFKGQEPYPEPWDPIVRHLLGLVALLLIVNFYIGGPLVLFVIMVPMVLLFLSKVIMQLVYCTLVLIDSISVNKEKALEYFDKMKDSSPELDMFSIEQSLVHGINGIADYLNKEKLQGSGIIATPYFGVEYVPKNGDRLSYFTTQEHDVNRYLILFRKHTEKHADV